LSFRVKNDLPVIKVYGGDVERALRIFRRRVDAGGILSALKTRRENPTEAGRKKFKRQVAMRRLKRKAIIDNRKFQKSLRGKIRLP